MKKRMTIMITALVVVFGGIIAFNVFKSFMMWRFFANYTAPAVSVAAITVQETNWHPKLAAVGNFVAINGVDISSEASGKVVKIHFDSGEYFVKDKPLIDIEDKSEQAALKYSQAELTLRELNYQRQADLFHRGAASSSTVDEAKANLQQALANVEKIEAEIRRKHILAPFAGQLGIRQVNLGQYITPGQTTIVTLQSLDPLYLQFYMPEHMLKNLHINQAIQFSVEEFPHALFNGKITAINAKVDTNTHNILVQASLANCPLEAINDRQSSLITRKQIGDDQLISCNSHLNSLNHVSQFAFIPGMFAAITVEQPLIPKVIMLPSTAISYSLYGNSVFVIEKEPNGKKDQDGKPILRAKRVFISTGEQEGNYTVINKGIEKGQMVVSSGELKLQNNALVAINNSVQLSDATHLGQ